MDKVSTRVLVVEDEPRYLRTIETTLRPDGYVVFTASNGEMAIQLASTKEPNLILLDVRLPDMSGYDVCQQIREFSTVPIIMLTAMAETADKIRGLEAGADDYVTKPFSAGELLARIAAVLRRVSFYENKLRQTIFRAGNF
ncbi:MAG: response regulator transcription factor [Chloroflexi bacterium]|nr:response regulator transcription factor [Chloroflexota bacterium]